MTAWQPSPRHSPASVAGAGGPCENVTPNFAVVEFYSSDWLAPIDNTGKKSGGLKDNGKAGLSRVQENLNLGVGLMYT